MLKTQRICGHFYVEFLIGVIMLANAFFFTVHVFMRAIELIWQDGKGVIQ